MDIKGTKKESRLIRWLQKNASSDPSRMALNGLHVENGKVIACNGYRMIVVDKPECMEEVKDSTTILGTIKAGDFEAPFTELEQKYPDYSKVIKYASGEPKAAITVNPKLLREMLDGLDDLPTTILLHEPTQPIEIFGKTRDQRDAYMILMPMHRSRDAKLERPDGTEIELDKT